VRVAMEADQACALFQLQLFHLFISLLYVPF